jgi:rod shape-determining protein MreD
MRLVFLAGWASILIVLQAVAGEHLALHGTTPDFMVILAAFVALYEHKKEAVKVALGAGLLADVLISTRLGPMMFSLTVACLTLATARPQRVRAQGLTGVMTVFFTALTAGLLYGLMRSLGWGGPPVSRPVALAFEIAAYSGVFAAVLFPLMVRSALWLGYPERCTDLHAHEWQWG